MTSLNAELVCSSADEAIAYYTAVFGAETTARYTVGDHVVSATMSLLGTSVDLKDEDEHDPSPTTLGAPGVLMSVTTDDPDSLAATMVEQGGQIVFEVADQPYGARGGRVRDPFGHQWMLQTPITMSPAEIQSAMDAYESEAR